MAATGRRVISFLLISCIIKISSAADACSKLPCKNGATCSRDSSLKGYRCRCKAGWEGDDCETDIDECQGVQCYHDGSKCVQNAPGSGYKCQCANGYIGTHCEHDIDECVGIMCKNGGQCAQNLPGQGYKCVCAAGYTGKRCESDIDECVGVSCANGGKCAQNSPGFGYTCQCTPGFTGVHCKNKHAIDLAILIDSSRSVVESEFELSKVLAKEIVRQFDVKLGMVRIATAEFSSNVKLGNWLEQSDKTDSVLNAIDTLEYDGTRANSWLGLRHARKFLLKTRGNRRGIPQVVLVLGSGETEDYLLTLEALEDLNRDGVRVYSVGCDTESNVLYTSLPVTSHFSLSPVVKKIEISNVYAPMIAMAIREDTNCKFGYRDNRGKCIDIDECHSVDPCHNGGECENNPGGYTCSCNTSRTGLTDCQVKSALDVVMILDSSEYVYQSEWPKLFNLYRALIRLLYVHPNYVRVSVLSYCETVHQGSLFDTCNDYSCLLRIVRTWTWKGGLAKPHIAFNSAVDNILKNGGKSRSKAKKVIVYVGSGETDDKELTAMALHRINRHRITLYSLVYNHARFILNKINRQNTIEIPNVLDFGTIWKSAVQLSELIMADSKCKFGDYFDSKKTKKCVDIDECAGSAEPCCNGGKCLNTVSGFSCPCAAQDLKCKELLVADVVIMLDTSSSLTASQFPKLKKTFQILATKFYISPEYTQISLTHYADKFTTDLHLGSCSELRCVQKFLASAKITQTSKSPDLSSALDGDTDDVMLGPGARLGVTKIVIYVGSGKGSKKDRVVTAIEHMWFARVRIYSVVPAVGTDHVTPHLPAESTFNWSESVYFDVAKKIAQDGMCAFGFSAGTDAICKDIDECSAIKIPCVNGGKCSNKLGTYNCICGTIPNCIQRTRIDIAILIDLSDTTTAPYLIDIGKEIVHHYAIHPDYVRVATAVYSDSMKIVTDLDDCDNSHCVLDSLDAVTTSATKQNAWLPFEKAVDILTGNGTRKNVPKAAIVVSSGSVAAKDRMRTLYGIINLPATGIRLYTMTNRGANDEVGDVMQQSINGFAIGPNKLTSAGITSVSLAVAKATIDNKDCKPGYSYIGGSCSDLDECSAKKPCVNNGGCLNMDAYFLCPCSFGQNNCIEMVKVDLAIILDSSTSIYKDEFKQLKQLAVNTIKEFYVHPDFAQMSVVAYADATITTTKLGACKTTDCVTATLAHLVHHDFQPETHTALSQVRTKVLVDGARSATKKVVIYIGSGATTERALTMLELSKFETENVRVYGFLYNIQDDVLRLMMNNYYYTDIPFSLTAEILAKAPKTMAQKISNDLMCPFGKRYIVSTKTCKDIDECASGFPCITGGKCFNTDGSYECKL
ncbi:collagen alpha-6(VI) chain-like [Tubulanus polymorphus]|uniref:collagen alpha-6(VI) chain-like n=1 Tax=Tubulanus polymorphus TaxID=672921 RepID=UPI003DA3D983